MIQFYPQIKDLHVLCVFASVLLLVIRGVLVLAGRPRFALAAPLRYLSYSIDTTLLTAALMLLAILPGAVFANHWLTVKLVLLVLYVLAGSRALRGERSAWSRAGYLTLALACIGLMVSIARAHHPLGVLRNWLAG